MPRRKVSVDRIVDDVVDTAVGELFERAEGWVEKLRTDRLKAIPEEKLRATYTCAACRRPSGLSDMEMVNPANEFGVCRGCFHFMWVAAEEKLRVLAKRAAQNAANRVAPGPTVPRRPPWEVLGVVQDAAVDEVKKAYRKLAMMYHPDHIPPGTSVAERELTQQKFLEVQRAYEVMMSVRQAAG